MRYFITLPETVARYARLSPGEYEASKVRGFKNMYSVGGFIVNATGDIYSNYEPYRMRRKK